MKVVPAEMAGYIDYLADEEQAGYFAAFHGLCRELIGVDPAGGDLCFLVAFGSVGQNFPVMNLVFHFVESGVCPSLWRMKFEPALCESNGQGSMQCGFRGRKIAAGAILPQRGHNLEPRS